MKLTFNAPVTLIFAILASIVFFFLSGAGHPPRIFVLMGDFQLSNWKWYFSLFGYTLGHGSTEHLIGNLSLLLLLGPILEEKYGSKRLLLMILLTALASALVHIIFFSENVVGASGIVFMMIVLVSLTNIKKGEIPITFILIMILYIGKEIYNAFQVDEISQFGHIIGGIIGAFFGFMFAPEKPGGGNNTSIPKEISPIL